MTLADECGYALLVDDLTRGRSGYSLVIYLASIAGAAWVECINACPYIFNAFVTRLSRASALRIFQKHIIFFHSCCLLEKKNFRNNHPMEITLKKFETPNNLIFGCVWYWIEELISFTTQHLFKILCIELHYPLSCLIRQSKILIRTLHSSFQDPFIRNMVNKITHTSRRDSRLRSVSGKKFSWLNCSLRGDGALCSQV